MVCVGEYDTCFGVCQLYTSCIQVGGQGVRSFPNQERNLNGDRQRVLCYHVVMASRKPKGIVDDIVGGIRDIVSPWLGTPPNPALSEELNNKIAQAQGLARGAAETLDQAFAGGMIKAGVQGNKALAKQAAINAAALGVGYVAGKVVQKVVQSGQAAVKGTYFGVHGSETQGLSSINPLIGKTKDVTNVTNNAARAAGYNVPDVPVAYSYPAQPNRVAGNLQTADAYARQGSVYVVNTPQTNVNVAQWNKVERYSPQPLKVVKEIKVPELPEYAPVYATREVRQSALANVNAARVANDAKMIRQVQNAVRNQKVKTFLQGAIKRR